MITARSAQFKLQSSHEEHWHNSVSSHEEHWHNSVYLCNNLENGSHWLRLITIITFPHWIWLNTIYFHRISIMKSDIMNVLQLWLHSITCLRLNITFNIHGNGLSWCCNFTSLSTFSIISKECVSFFSAATLGYNRARKSRDYFAWRYEIHGIITWLGKSSASFSIPC